MSVRDTEHQEQSGSRGSELRGSGEQGFRGLYELVDGVVRSEGLELYDLERTSGGGGRSVLRVFLSKPAAELPLTEATEGVTSASEGKEGVSLDDCALVSRKLSALDRFEEFIGENSVLEVSSPGINRKLRTESHFRSAIGERVSVKAYFESEGKERTVRGYLLGFEGGVIQLKPEHHIGPRGGGDAQEEVLKIELRNVTNARVDFDFSQESNPKGKRQ